MKTLDDLIRFLLEEIALCGNQGAHPSKILQSIDTFYEQENCVIDLANDNNKRSTRSFPVDRPFQERIWRWLVKNPECRVGLDGHGNSLTLSEVEAVNSISSQQEHIPVDENAPSGPQLFTSHSQRTPAQAESMKNSSHKLPTYSDQAHLQVRTDIGKSQSNPAQELRLYTSDDRMWCTLTGHGVDFSKIHHLEFALLSIIAAYGSKGIIQPTLVRISNQDKRSVPQRTQRLYDGGYIIKRPIQAEGCRTSICFLKRFVSNSTAGETSLLFADSSTQPAGASSGQTTLNPCFTNGGTDVVALSRIIFEILKEKKIISRIDLKTRLGVTDSPRARLVFSKTLRKLMALGCLKEVKAFDNTPRPTLKYFRSIKLIREPGEQECRIIFGKGYGKMFLENPAGEGDMDSQDDDVDDDQAEEPSDRIPVENLEEVERPIPQWTGTGCVYNFLHDLIQKSGTQGMMTKDIKTQAFGKAMVRPIDSQLARLTQCWQISQPIHLRHLAIVRDIELTRRTSHYVYFTYDNFTKLVDSGNASWEAVVTIADNDKLAQPNLDEFGFPSLDTTLFQDRENFATLAECNSALKIVPLRHIRDWIVKKGQDGTWGVEYVGGRYHSTLGRPLRSSKVLKGGPKGRPRKVPISGMPKGMNVKQVKKFKVSQRMAAQYRKRKAENEMDRRIGEGEDPMTVRKEVFAKVIAYYVEVGEELPSMIKDMIAFYEQEEVSGGECSEPRCPAVLDAEARPIMLSLQSDGINPSFEEKASGPCRTHEQLNQATSPLPSAIASLKRNRSESDTPMSFEYLPSIISHTRPLLNEHFFSMEITDKNTAATHFPPSKNRRVKGNLSNAGKPLYLRETSYEEQAKSINRAGSGAFVGRLAGAPRKIGKRGRTRHSRLAIFKSALLVDFTWFVEEAVNIEKSASRGLSHEVTSSERPLESSPNVPALDIAHKPSISMPAIKPAKAPKKRPEFVKPIGAARGSMGVLRRKIIMDIVQTCGGIYPGARELMPPFYTAWMKLQKLGKPDPRTLQTAFAHLVQSGKLKQITFSFRCAKGSMVTRTMATLMDISPTDQRVKDMQKHIKDSWPIMYLPPQAEYTEESRTDQSYVAIYGRQKNIGYETQEQVQLEHKFMFDIRYEEQQAKYEMRDGERQARNDLKTTSSEVRKRERRATHAEESDLRGHLSHDAPIYQRLTGAVAPARKVERLSKYLAQGNHGLAAGPSDTRFSLTPLKRASKKPTQMTNPLMNPVHVFHQATGTFSIDFSGFRIQPLYLYDTSMTRPIRRAEPDFMAEVDDLLAWELKTENLPDVIFRDSPFVNHGLEQTYEVPRDIYYQVSKGFEVYFSSATTGLLSNRPRLASNLSKPRVTDRAFTREIEHVVPAAPPAATPGANGKSLKRKRTAATTRQLTSQAEKQQVIYIDGRPKKLRRIRGPHVENPLSIDEEKRLLVAVTIIRTLTGGIDKNIDWVLIARLFQPKFSQFYIQRRWGHVLHRYRLQVDQIQAKFQDHFANAYEEGRVPRIDFDNLEAYDWAWLVDWTLENIETSKDNMPYLPATRSELECFFDLQEASDDDMGEYFEIDSSSLAQRREVVLNRRPNVYPADRTHLTPPNQASENLAVAKTWIRANVVTPQANYNSDLARAKLAPIGESTVTTALQELLAARVLSQQNKGRLVPGRNYDISDYFVNRLKKKLEPSHFHQAVRYKRRMDAEFWKNDRVMFSTFAANGDVMAVLNMLAHRRIIVKPKNPPINKFGFTDGTYQTRLMDKTRLNFDVEIRLRPTYISGNPLLPLPSVPCPHLDDQMAKIPLWYDIHGNLVPIMWEFALSAVLTILCKRPGVPADSLLIGLKPSLELWELCLILEWTVRAKATRKMGGSYALEEWWWMCLGDGGGGE